MSRYLNVEKIITDVFKFYGVSEETSFTPAEYEDLEKLYPKLPQLRELEALKNQKGAQKDSITAQLSDVDQKITDIGTLPDTAPEAFVEREAWMRLKDMKASYETQKAQLTAEKTSVTSEYTALNTQVTALRGEMKL